MAALVQEDDCGVCKKAVKEADNGLKCDSCDDWFHAGCEKVNKDRYLFLVKFKDQLWLCRKCKPEIKNAVHKAKELRKEVEDLRKQLQDIKAEMISEVKHEVKNEIKNEIKDELRDEIKSTFNEEKLVKRTIEKVFEQMHEHMREQEDRQNRKNNLVMYNVPESTHQDPRERQTQDLAFCQDVIENSLGVDGRAYEMVTVIRLGKTRTDDRNRPVLIKMKSEYEKWEILRNAKNLKYERDDNKKKIGISLDLTAQQREHDRKLRNELKERREKGETGLYIKNGVLCKAGGARGRTY